MCEIVHAVCHSLAIFAAVCALESSPIAARVTKGFVNNLARHTIGKVSKYRHIDERNVKFADKLG